MDIRLEIERLSHDIQIRRAELSPAAVSNCDASSVKLSVGLLNQGKRDEDEIVVEAVSSDLQFSKKIENIELDQDDSTSVAFDIPVAKGAREGIARVDIKTYFDSVAPSNSASVELNVNECAEEADEEPVVVKPAEEKKTTVVVPQSPITPSPGQAQAAPKKQTSFTDSKAYVALLVVLSVLIAAVIVTLVIMMTRKKRPE
jgi:hypothetical protein